MEIYEEPRLTKMQGLKSLGYLWRLPDMRMVRFVLEENGDKDLEKCGSMRSEKI